MNPENHGLTIGELTIAIGALMLIALIWTGITQKDRTNGTSLNQVDSKVYKALLS